MAPSKKTKAKSTKTKKSALPITSRLNKLPFHLQKEIYSIVTQQQYPLKEDIDYIIASQPEPGAIFSSFGFS